MDRIEARQTRKRDLSRNQDVGPMGRLEGEARILLNQEIRHATGKNIRVGSRMITGGYVLPFSARKLLIQTAMAPNDRPLTIC